MGNYHEPGCHATHSGQCSDVRHLDDDEVAIGKDELADLRATVERLTSHNAVLVGNAEMLQRRVVEQDDRIAALAASMAERDLEREICICAAVIDPISREIVRGSIPGSRSPTFHLPPGRRGESRKPVNIARHTDPRWSIPNQDTHDLYRPSSRLPNGSDLEQV